MKGDTKVIEYLNRGLRSELTAVSQFWLHYRLLDNWGLDGLAKKWREESIEEMRHADRFIDRIIFLEGVPNLQTLNPLQIGQNVDEIMAADLAAETQPRVLYRRRRVLSRRQRFPSRDLFEALMNDEEGHVDFLETQIDLIKRVGVERYSQARIGGLGEGGSPGFRSED